MQQHRSPNKHWREVARLAAGLAAMAAIWLAALPYLGERPTVRAYINRNEAAGIDPSAKFYTELPAIFDLLNRVEAARKRESGKSW